MQKTKPLIVQKAWGHETIFGNESGLYCGKLLTFTAGKKFSMHYHMLKDEAWYVTSGKLILRWIDTATAAEHEDTLLPGDVVRVERGQPHQLEAIETSVVFEVSTQHFDTDSYRVRMGDSQK